MKKSDLRLVPKPLATIIPCPYEQREDASRSIAQKLDVIAAELEGLVMGATEIEEAGIALELRALARGAKDVRRKLEVDDVG